MKAAILGTGFGSYHAQLYGKVEGVELTRIFGRNPEKLKKLQQELNVEVTQDMNDILKDPSIDLIDICLPTSEHRSYIIEALKAGKHVYCETPLCYSMEDARLIFEAEKLYNRRVFVDLFVKFTPEYQFLRQAIHNNNYGALKAISIVRNTAAIWGPLGPDKIVLDLMLHDLDLAVWFLGSRVDIQAVGIEGKPGTSCVKAILKYPDAIASLEASAMMPEAYPFTVACEAIFEHASFYFREAFTPEGLTKTCTLYTSEGREDLCLRDHDPYEYAIRHVVDCIQGSKDSSLGADAAASAIDLALTITSKLINQ